MNSLRMSFWMVPASFSGGTPCSSAATMYSARIGQHGAVHRHRHAHLVERDAVEELPHVVDRVDRDARHADVTGHPRMVAVVAAVGGQVEGDRQALLPGGEVAPVEGVGLLGGGEARVLADRPRLVDVHRRVRAAQVRRDARVGPAGSPGPSRSAAGVERLDRDALRASPTPGRRSGRCSPDGRRQSSARRRRSPDRQGDPGEVGDPISATPIPVEGGRRARRAASQPGEDVRVDAARVRRPVPAPARNPARARRPQRRGHGRGLLGVQRVAGAQAGHRRAAARNASAISAASVRARGRARCRPPGRGWRRTWRGRCARRPGRARPGRPRGRAPAAARCASERARSASNASSRRTPRQAARRARLGRGLALDGQRSAGCGNSLTPVIGFAAVGEVRRRALPRSRRAARRPARRAARRPARRPARSPGTTPRPRGRVRR